MSISSRIIAKVFKLPAPETHDVVVERNLKVPMPDGVVLLADHYYPRGSQIVYHDLAHPSAIILPALE
jgi:hypothetical protein